MSRKKRKEEAEQRRKLVPRWVDHGEREAEWLKLRSERDVALSRVAMLRVVLEDLMLPVPKLGAEGIVLALGLSEDRERVGAPAVVTRGFVTALMEKMEPLERMQLAQDCSQYVMPDYDDDDILPTADPEDPVVEEWEEKFEP